MRAWGIRHATIWQLHAFLNTPATRCHCSTPINAEQFAVNSNFHTNRHPSWMTEAQIFQQKETEKTEFLVRFTLADAFSTRMLRTCSHQQVACVPATAAVAKAHSGNSIISRPIRVERLCQSSPLTESEMKLTDPSVIPICTPPTW